MKDDLEDLASRNWIHEDKQYRLPGNGQLRLANVILCVAAFGLAGVIALLIWILS